jgi:hypothetical protein
MSKNRLVVVEFSEFGVVDVKCEDSTIKPDIVSFGDCSMLKCAETIPFLFLQASPVLPS